MQQTEIRCRKCGKKLLTYSQINVRKYKSPLHTCKKCGTKYIDPRCHEIAIEGIPADTFQISSYVILMIFGALILYRGIYLFGMHQMGVPDSTQWILPSVFAMGGLVMIIGGIAEIVMIITGIKAQKYERLRRQSEDRLRNKSYVYTLQDLGYQIPEEYL